MYRSGNPTLRDSTFQNSTYQGAPWWDSNQSQSMTIEGVAEKTGVLLLITATVALATAFTATPESAFLFIILGFLGSLILSLFIVFRRSINPGLICAHSAFEGLFIGGLTWFYEVALDLPGIGIIAAVLTFAILAAMLAIYRAGLIAWNRNLAIAVASSVVAIILIYIVSIIGAITGAYSVPYIHDATPIGIAFSLFVIAIGALCLVADFDFIERGVQSGARKELEWTAAFGLMVTLVWLYIEILRLLAKVAYYTSRR
ncbi:MAG: Bax inhibitor-1/YccA family protein [Euryarchaeota archaeon TMED192]|nr:MAG: Bax inhibitor-1/YccA family protein [Euryarchaeota archaeon TMED192]